MTTTENNLLTECNECTHKYSRRAEKCPKCGATLKVSCNICQSKIPSDSKSCPECGDPRPFEAIDIDAPPDQELTQPESTDNHTSQELSEQEDSRPIGRSSETLHSEEPQVEEGRFRLTTGQILWSFEGRITRRQFWTYYVGFIWGPLATIYFLYLSDNSQEVSQATSNIWLFLVLLAIWPSLAIQVKRWHDRNKPGVWVFINAVPIIGTLWFLIELGILRGTHGRNRYGNDPLETNTYTEATSSKQYTEDINQPKETTRPSDTQDSLKKESVIVNNTKSLYEQNKADQKITDQVLWLFGTIVVVGLIAVLLKYAV